MNTHKWLFSYRYSGTIPAAKTESDTENRSPHPLPSPPPPSTPSRLHQRSRQTVAVAAAPGQPPLQHDLQPPPPPPSRPFQRFRCTDFSPHPPCATAGSILALAILQHRPARECPPPNGAVIPRRLRSRILLPNSRLRPPPWRPSVWLLSIRCCPLRVPRLGLTGIIRAATKGQERDICQGAAADGRTVCERRAGGHRAGSRGCGAYAKGELA